MAEEEKTEKRIMINPVFQRATCCISVFMWILCVGQSIAFFPVNIASL